MARKEPKKSRINLYINILWISFFSFIGLLFLVFVLISYGVLGPMPSFEQLENPKSNLATEIISTDQVTLGSYFSENRTRAEFEEISPYAVDALVATEDSRFYSHSGIDFWSLARVLLKTVLSGDEDSGGGSTVSQQLAKLLFPRERFSSAVDMVSRKFREWVIAIKLEKSYTKEEIITMYFNEFDFLYLAVGIKNASHVYFDCRPNELKIEEAAMLVGMLKNPALFNPVRHPKRALERRNVVLSQMLKYDKINEAQYDSLKKLPLTIKFQQVDHKMGKAPYLREYLRTVMSAEKPERENFKNPKSYSEDSARWEDDPLYGWIAKNLKPDGNQYDLYRDGLKIYTTIDSRMQDYAEKAVVKHMSEDLQPAFFREQKGKRNAPFASILSQDQITSIMTSAMMGSERYRMMREGGASEADIKRAFMKKIKMKIFSYKGDKDTLLSPWDSIRYVRHFLHAGLMSMEPQTGYIRAYVGGINYEHFQYDHVILQKRQVGSTFKPFLYTLAMQEGLTPCHKVANVPTTFEVNDTIWTPDNSDNAHSGEMVTLAWGLAQSNNYVSAKLMQMLKPEPVVNIAHEMGVKSFIPAVPAICLGVAEISLYEMVGAYGTFANKGIYTQPIFVTRIEDKYGNVISTFTPKRNEAISEETAYTMVLMMQNVVNHGTSVRLRYRYKFDGQIAGKTGTTNDHADGWFIGYTPELVTGIWVGGEERSIRFAGIAQGQGATVALPIWAYYMKDVLADSVHLPYRRTAVFERPTKAPFSSINCQGEAETQDAELEDVESNFY